MKKKVIKGNSPLNARIKINYEGVKPDVQFSYPAKAHQFKGSMFLYIFFVMFILVGLVFYVSQAVTNYNLNRDPFTSKYDITMKYNIALLNNYTLCVLNNSNLTFTNLTTYPGPCTYEYYETWDNLIQDYRIIYIIGIAYLISLIIYFPFKRMWINIYPKFWSRMGRKKIMIFSSENIRHSEEWGYYCEVPVFSNVILDYKATKDFSRQLKHFEIEEHSFKEYAKFMRYKEWLQKKKKKRAKRNSKHNGFNEWIWYARFYFKQKPLSGNLTVIFR